MKYRYVFNGRLYHLAATNTGWTITTGRPGDTPIHRTFTDESIAQATWSRMIACTPAFHPRRLRSAHINGTLIVLVPDTDGRTHLGELNSPAGDTAYASLNRTAAIRTWRHCSCQLISATTPMPA